MAERFDLLSGARLFDKHDGPLRELGCVLRQMDRLSLQQRNAHSVVAGDHRELPAFLNEWTSVLA